MNIRAIFLQQKSICTILFNLLRLSCMLSSCWDINYGNFDGKGDVITTDIEQTNRNTNNITSYGVDISYPVHHEFVSDNYAWLPHNVDPEHNEIPRLYHNMPVQPLGDRTVEYKKLMEGCRKYYGKSGDSCDYTERDRIEMSLRQPASMQNYTDIGFKKIRAPSKLRKLLDDFWSKNENMKYKNKERWNKGNTYTNHWDAPTYMVSVEDVKLRGGGQELKNALWDAARDTIEDWIDKDLTSCSLYGVRVYTQGAVLATHVDRMPLITSAIVNVAQDVDEPWPIEVIGHDGKAQNITMEPGDMVLYESHSILHGRPFSLKGRYFANIFIHFEPVGHSKRHGYINGSERANSRNKLLTRYRQAVKERKSGHENDQGLPMYIVKGSIEAQRWFEKHQNRNPLDVLDSSTTGSTEAHQAAQLGDVESLKEIIDELEHLVNAKDSNGWTPLHEGVRGGHSDVVSVLIHKGANINERTNHGRGGTALWWAIEQHGADHEVVSLLEEFGGEITGPEL